MGISFTKKQQEVIDARGCNLLVAAAAGSGKTAVLVERIVKMVSDGADPVDIDRLLVVTFTNAAAAEMRERISRALNDRLAADPENEHLQRQVTLLHNARITTIDSFCLFVLRNQFHTIGLDPGFRIAEEGEGKLMRQEALEAVLEAGYAAGEAGFLRCMEYFSWGSRDTAVEEIVLKLYDFAMSTPFPEQWLTQRKQDYLVAGSPHSEAGDLEAAVVFEEIDWVRELMRQTRLILRGCAEKLTDAVHMCEEADGPYMYGALLEREKEMVEGLLLKCEKQGLQDGGYDLLCAAFGAVKFDRLPSKKDDTVSALKREVVKSIRTEVKEQLGDLQKRFFFKTRDQVLGQMEICREAVEALVDLTLAFKEVFDAKKRDKNILDFNDIEHFALSILVRRDGEGRCVPTETALEYRSHFHEILIDEYQDSNLVQEYILSCISGEEEGRYNRFMVGDVKQSIYKFRLARPELFLEKYHTYEAYDQAVGTNKKIELHQNFRSRAEVLEGINDVFYRIMTEDLGGIRYTEDAALHPGAVFPELENTFSGAEDRGSRVELLAVDTGAEAFAGLEEDAADFTARELEAKLIAGKIREMTSPDTGLFVWDKRLNGTGGYRTAKYRDMVILLRSTAGWTENFLSVLMNEGIPVCAESRMGYFAAAEVEIVLSMLAVIDNPMQDIPLAAVLKSPMAGVTDLELAELTAYYQSCGDKGQDRGIFGAVSRFLEDMGGEDDSAQEEKTKGLYKKLCSFRSMLRRFRTQSAYLPIHELIYKVYEETGYYHYVSAMPAGETRKANLDMLVEKAADYERTSYKGLFHFIRYIENLKKYNMDFGEASTMGEEEDTVRIMSIHKSKGLEFPVVFLAGMGKKFNKQDACGKILIDPELGIATDYLDLERRLKTTTLKKNVVRRKMELDNLGEELRVLYVAMTRAKEKLIMTGTDSHLEKSLEKYSMVPLVNGQVPYTILASAGSYLDWLLMSLSDGHARIRFTEIPLADVVGEELVRQAKDLRSKETLLNLDPQKEYKEEYRRLLTEHLGYEYPYMADIRLHTKMSVSELKKQGQMEDEAESAVLLQRGKAVREKEAEISHYLEEVSRSDGYGATRGTAYHRVMELLPFARMESLEDVAKYLSELTQKGRLSRESLDLIDCNVIWKFLQSNLGKRMSLAEKEERLHKEQQFVVGIPARDMKAADSDELVVVQGIIDAYMEEEGELVVVDYKTDKVSSVRILLERYKEQLDYYGRALEQMTGKKVKAKILYSLTMQREIEL